MNERCLQAHFCGLCPLDLNVVNPALANAENPAQDLDPISEWIMDAKKLRKLANGFLNGSMAMRRLVDRPGLDLADGSDRGSRLIQRRSP